MKDKNMKSKAGYFITKTRGFSLIEILVGMVIGLIATAVIMTVFANFEGQRRTTSGASDSQTNGSIALFNLQRDIQMAGYGLPLPMADPQNSSLKCDPLPLYDPDTDPITDNDIKLFPIEIVNGADGASDTIKVRYSPTSAGSIPVRIISISPFDDMSVDNNLGCKDGDVAVINQGNACFMTLLGNPDVDGYGAKGKSDDDTHAGIKEDFPGGSPFTSGSAKLTCMGDWQEFGYRIEGSQLVREVRNPEGVRVEPVVDEIVAIQAQYGVSETLDSNSVTSWQDAIGDWSSANLAANVERRNRIKAIRVAAVARIGLREKTTVTETCTTFQGVVNNGPCAWDDEGYDEAPVIDLAPLYPEEGEWQFYRYRSFETIIPLRNMLWSKGAL